MRQIHGKRDPENGAITVTIGVDGQMQKPLPVRLDLRSHTAGFNWGYGGSGPSQLALAMCAAIVGDQRAQRVYQDFKLRVTGTMQAGEWWMTEEDVRRIVREIEREQMRAGQQRGSMLPLFGFLLVVMAVVALSGHLLGVWERLADGRRPLIVFQKPNMGQLEEEMASNEAECRKAAPPKHAAYVVTRWGQLVGCLIVPEYINPSDQPRRLPFVWRKPSM